MAGKGWPKKPKKKKVKRKAARVLKKNRPARFTKIGVREEAFLKKAGERANVFKLSEVHATAKDFLLNKGWHIGKKFIYSPELWESLRHHPIKFRRVLRPRSIKWHPRISPMKVTVHLMKAVTPREKRWLLDNNWVKGRKLIWHPDVRIKTGMWRGRKKPWRGITLVDQEKIILEVMPELPFVDKLKVCPWDAKKVRERGLIGFNLAKQFIELRKVDAFPAEFVSPEAALLFMNWVKEDLGGGIFYFHPKHRKRIRELKMPVDVLVYPLEKSPVTGLPASYLSLMTVERLADRYGCFDIESLESNVVDLMKKKGWEANQFWLWNPLPVEEKQVAKKKAAVKAAAKPEAKPKSEREIYLEKRLAELENATKMAGKKITLGEYQNIVRENVFKILDEIGPMFSHLWSDPQRIPIEMLTRNQIQFLEERMIYFRKGKYLVKLWY